MARAEAGGLRDAARALARELGPVVPHVVGVWVRRIPGGSTLGIVVDIDAESARRRVPRRFRGHRIQVRLVDTPRFASTAR